MTVLSRRTKYGDGGLLRDYRLCNPATGAGPLTAAAAGVKALTTPTSNSALVEIAVGDLLIAEVDVYRCLSVTTNASFSSNLLQVICYGKDIHGDAVKTTVNCSTNGGETKAFPIPVVDIGAFQYRFHGTISGRQFSLGFHSTLGVPVRLGASSDIKAKYIADDWADFGSGTEDTSGTLVHVGQGRYTWAPASAPNDSRQYGMRIASTYR